MLPPETKLKLIAIHKETFEEFTKIITYQEWKELKRNRNYYYKSVKV